MYIERHAEVTINKLSQMFGAIKTIQGTDI